MALGTRRMGEAFPWTHLSPMSRTFRGTGSASQPLGSGAFDVYDERGFECDLERHVVEKQILRFQVNQQLESGERLRFRHVNQRRARAVPAAAIEPGAFSAESVCSGACA